MQKFVQTGPEQQAAHLVVIVLMEENPAMVSTQPKANAGRNMGTKIELLCKHISVKMCGYRE